MIISVVIPTYCRPKDLQHCLDALKKQARPPDEVLVVVRDNDAKTWAMLEDISLGHLTLRAVAVTTPGYAAALNAGLDATRGDIITITDDDTAPRPDWLARIENHFQADPRVGGVGGRDWVREGDRVHDEARVVVGKVQWFGRMVGNHHLGVGPPREVDILKGANMSFRRAAVEGIRVDERLRGTGAQPRADYAFCLVVKRAGWRLIYDPAVAVDHYAAPRLGDSRVPVSAIEVRNDVHNQTLMLL
jgi:cellulose synthase/poly-beta-1,6-N-acetylglucosamine synthase-like glycosyltransferase